MTLKQIEEMDRADPLAAMRDEFLLPEGKIYLDGNSLGALPKRASERVQRVLQREWGEDLIASWNSHGWIELPERVGDKIGGLLGARAGQVICCDSVSVNLFKLLAAALRLQPGRRCILSLDDNFPTDLYIAEGLKDLLGEDRCRLRLVAPDALQGALKEKPAVVLLTQVNFRSGELLDIEALTGEAHDQGALVIWDLSHSTGVIPLHLDRWQVDFAVGCGYKYLNGGPGAPAFVYAAQRHQQSVANPLSGWMGHQAPFAFEAAYRAGEGITRLLTGTPGILSMSSLDAALELFSEISVEQLRAKSVALSELFLSLLQQAPNLQQLRLCSPRDPQLRGSQLAFAHPDAYSLCQALIANGVIGDFRSPNLLRFGFSPLFLRYQDIWQAIQLLDALVERGDHLQARFQGRGKVT